jgi:RNA polymerase sigma factor (sigma-70 family)
LTVTNSTPQSKAKKAGNPRVLKQEKASRAEVKELVSSARAGDGKARKQLIDAYSYLPLHFATTNGAAAERLSEAIKVGMEALQLAIDQYQLDAPEHFTVYVRRWINRRIQMHLRGISKPVKVKRKRLSKYKQQMDFRIEALRALGNQVKLRLNAQEYAVIEYRYGLNGKARKTLDEVAELVGVSRQRVHHVESHAIKKLLGDEPM